MSISVSTPTMMGIDDAETRAPVPIDDVDREIVQRVKQGQKDAFDLLVLKYQHRVHYVVSRYVDNRSDAADVVQDTFLRAYRGLAGFRGDAKFSTWLQCIAANTAKNHLKRVTRSVTEQGLSESELELAHEASPEHDLVAEDITKTVSRAMDELSPELRTAIILRELEGYRYEAIAKLMGCPVGTIRSRIFRAREYIARRLEPVLA